MIRAWVYFISSLNRKKCASGANSERDENWT